MLDASSAATRDSSLGVLDPGTSLEEIAACEQAHARNPEDFEPIARAMSILTRAGREDLLRPWAERAFVIDASRWESLYALALTDELAGRFERAVVLWQDLLARHPDVDPHGLYLGRAFLGAGQLQKAYEISETALRRLASNEPFSSSFWQKTNYLHHMHILHSEILLRAGDVRGFAHQLAQIAVRVPSFAIPGVPVWRSQRLDGLHVLVTGAGGYGDQLLFASLLPRLRELGARMTLAVHHDIADLVAASLPEIRVIAVPAATRIAQPPTAELAVLIAEDPPDVQMTLYHVPLAHVMLRPGAFVFPAYLRVPELARDAARDDVAALRERAAGRALVGVAWDRLQRHYPEIFGAIEASRTSRSSLPVDELVRIVGSAGLSQRCHFVALHEREGLREWPAEPLENLSLAHIEPGNFSKTAAVIDACDSVVSVDMSVANLAALLGKPTRLVLAHESDWRWGLGASSTWIAGTQNFRQIRSGLWKNAVDALIASL